MHLKELHVLLEVHCENSENENGYTNLFNLSALDELHDHERTCQFKLKLQQTKSKSPVMGKKNVQKQKRIRKVKKNKISIPTANKRYLKETRLKPFITTFDKLCNERKEKKVDVLFFMFQNEFKTLVKCLKLN